MATRVTWFLAGLFLLLSVSFVSGKERAARSGIEAVLDDLFKVRLYKEVTLAPDGKRVAWVEALRGKKDAPPSQSAIYVADLKDSATPRRIMAGNGKTAHDEHGLAWSPDGSRL